MIDTTISISGVSIHEPMTVFTDLLIAAFAIAFYFQLKNKEDAITRDWSYFFLFLGLSTFFGACSHAFFAVHEGWRYKSFWLPMQIINGFGIYFAQQATFRTALENSTNRTKWKWSYMIQLAAFIIALLWIQKYIVTIIENAIGLIPVMILHYQHKRSFSRMIANGIAISFITAFVNLGKLSLHAYFNYNDIAHVFILISLYVIYKGVRMRPAHDEKALA
jgi:hypothetical protein